MSFIELTRMIESKQKDDEAGDLIVYAFADRGKIWIRGANICAMSSLDVRVEVSWNEFEDHKITQLTIVGEPDPVYVSETPADIIGRLSG